MGNQVRAAIYARVSDEKQVQMSGLDTQVRECQRFAQEQGYQVVAVYKDEGISGAHGIAHRAELEKCLMGAKSGQFQVLLVHEMDRLARELGVGLMILAAAVVDSGITLISVNKRTTFSEAGALLGLVEMWTASEDRKKILQRTKRGQIERARRGKVSGPPPLGYDRTDDGKLAINEDEAELVRRIYHLYLHEGHHLDSLASLLNAEGVKTKRAKLNELGKNNYRGADRWQRSTIQCVLKNSVYKGEYVYGKTQGRVPAGKDYNGNEKRPMLNPKLQTSVKNRSFLPHEVVSVPVPAIVPPETWEQVQAKLLAGANKANIRKGATKYTYRFSGIVRCHHCGRVMTRMTMSTPRKDGTERKTAYYTCRNQEKACPNAHKHHPMKAIDHEIVHRLLPYLKDPELVREGLGAELARKERAHADLMARLKHVETQVIKTKSRKQRLLELYLDEEGRMALAEFKAHDANFDADLDRLNVEMSALQSELAALSFDEDKTQVEAVVAYFGALFTQDLEPHMQWLWATSIGAPEGLDVVGEDFQLSDDHEAVSTIVELAQRLVKTITVDTDGKVVDYVLRIKTTPPTPTGTDGEVSDHIANLKCITSPSFTS